MDLLKFKILKQNYVLFDHKVSTICGKWNSLNGLTGATSVGPTLEKLQMLYPKDAHPVLPNIWLICCISAHNGSNEENLKYNLAQISSPSKLSKSQHLPLTQKNDRVGTIEEENMC